MSEKKTDRIRPRVEMFVIGVFALASMIWMVSKCNNARQEYQQEALAEEGNEEEITSIAAQEQTQPEKKKEEKVELVKPEAPPLGTIKEKIVPLYVTIKDLKLRDKPSLEGRILTSLSLFEEVTFLNEITEFKQEINLGFEVAKEPWVKVKTERGYIGWVYGAGVHFYKRKREPEEKQESPETES